MLLNCGAGEDSWKSLDFQEIKPVNPTGNRPWLLIGTTDAEAEDSILWPPDMKSQLIGKDPNAGKDWRKEETGMAEDEMIGWHHWLNGYEFEQTPGDSEEQGSPVCCRSWGFRESDTTEQLNNKQQKIEEKRWPVGKRKRIHTSRLLLCVCKHCERTQHRKN